MNAQEKVEAIIRIAEDAKAERIETLDVRAKTSMADYFIVCSANNDRHVAAIADRVDEKLREQSVRPLRTEGEGTGWVLMDFGDVVFHIMREEQRQFYDLETLWKSLQRDPNLI
ncbi:MAG: ribosome silencing factor [Fimbriimonadales bacterium]|nr:ribosome silencing factor [Fimbriimonadales bacterium]